MKTNFFGFSAKLALAIMAVSGTLFTSCYDSVDNDVTPPYVAPNALYSVTGSVTNLASGLPVNNVTLTFSGPASINATATGGSYSFTTETAGTYNVTLDATTAANYTIAYGSSVTIATLPKGQSATYMQNVVLAPKNDTGFNGMKINFSSENEGTSSKTFDATTDSRVDIVNDGNSFTTPYFTMVVDTLGRFVQDDLGIQPAATSRAADITALKAYITNYLTNIYSQLPVNKADNFKTGKKKYEFQLGPNSSVKTISATTKYKNDTYQFTFDGVSYTIIISAVSAYEFANTQYSNDIYHGHGHGHGHGDDLNAGGGIISGEM